MTLARFAAVTALIGLAQLSPPAASEFAATLERDITHGDIRVGMIMAPVNTESREPIRGLVPDDAFVCKGALAFPKGAYIPLYLAELGDGAFVVLGDFNQDKRIAPEERVPLSGLPGAPPAIARVVMPGGAFTSYPVGFQNPRHGPSLLRADGTPLPDRLMMTFSIDVVVRGTVTIGDRRVAFELPIDAEDGKLHLDRNVHYLDLDGDGRFDRDVRARERLTALGAPPVFRAGETYLSIKTADVAAGRAAFAVRTAADYERIEVDRGALVPDFSFVDLAGNTRRLSQFRGKFVLLDFWGTWCGPCLAELPFLSRAYAQFHARGFEIVGMDDEKPDVTAADFSAGVARVTEFLQERGLTWPQARTSSIKQLFERRFQIGVWPTMILLDREGRVISAGREDLGEPGLKGEALLSTLTELFKKTNSQGEE